MGKITRAIISVTDKTGIADFARSLSGFGVEILSTGGTARVLREGGTAVKDISEYTGFPEMMDGRVKTLHPKVHGGLLGLRDNPEHQKMMEDHGIEPIDMVVVNLYQFENTIAKDHVTLEEAIENIDIGGTLHAAIVRQELQGRHGGGGSRATMGSCWRRWRRWVVKPPSKPDFGWQERSFNLLRNTMGLSAVTWRKSNFRPRVTSYGSCGRLA